MTYLLRFFEILWTLAIVAAVAVGTYHLITKGSFDHQVYFPYICAGLSTIVLFNLRSQRKFTERHQQKSAPRDEGA